MSARHRRTLAASGAVLASLLTAGVASAQYDGPRFRGGIALEGGALLVPGTITLGSGGVQGQLGVQINDQWAVYALPTFVVLAGSGAFGFGGGSAILAEFTFPGVPLSIGAGPEAGAFFAVSSFDSAGGGAGVGGLTYGGRARFAYHPIIARGENGIRRKALSIGVDFRFVEGSFGGDSGTAVPGSNSFAVSPVAWLGYTAF